MRELTDGEFNLLGGLCKGRFTLIYARVSSLETGKGLVIEISDWKTNRTPYRIVRNVAKNTGRKFDYGRMPDGSGWFVKRVA